MKYLPSIFLLAALCLASGCDNAYINPDVAKALSEQRQETLETDKLDALNRIADAAERIAKAQDGGCPASCDCGCQEGGECTCSQ